MDGDTDTPPVREDFKNVVRQHIQYIQQQAHDNPQSTSNGIITHVPNGVAHHGDTVVHDLESTDHIDTISEQVHKATNGVNHMANGVAKVANGYMANGKTSVANGKVPKFSERSNMRNMYNEISHI